MFRCGAVQFGSTTIEAVKLGLRRFGQFAGAGHAILWVSSLCNCMSAGSLVTEPTSYHCSSQIEVGTPPLPFKVILDTVKFSLSCRRDQTNLHRCGPGLFGRVARLRGL